MTPSPQPVSDCELDDPRARCRELWRHVNEVHGVRAEGTAGQIEAGHMRALRAEGSAWHDAWTLPDLDAEAGR